MQADAGSHRADADETAAQAVNGSGLFEIVTSRWKCCILPRQEMSTFEEFALLTFEMMMMMYHWHHCGSKLSVRQEMCFDVTLVTFDNIDRCHGTCLRMLSTFFGPAPALFWLTWALTVVKACRSSLSSVSRILNKHDGRLTFQALHSTLCWSLAVCYIKYSILLCPCVTLSSIHPDSGVDRVWSFRTAAGRHFGATMAPVYRIWFAMWVVTG